MKPYHRHLCYYHVFTTDNNSQSTTHQSHPRSPTANTERLISQITLYTLQSLLILSVLIVAVLQRSYITVSKKLRYKPGGKR